LESTIHQRREGEASAWGPPACTVQLNTSARFSNNSYHHHYTISRKRVINMR